MGDEIKEEAPGPHNALFNHCVPCAVKEHYKKMVVPEGQPDERAAFLYLMGFVDAMMILAKGKSACFCREHKELFDGVVECANEEHDVQIKSFDLSKAIGRG